MCIRDSAQSVSDIFLYGSFISTVSFLSRKKSRNEIGNILALWGEASLLNGSITYLSKFSIRRIRPFAYNPSVDISKKQSVNAKISFFSGHTSITATNTIFIAKVFNDLYPESKWKNIIWGTAIVIPAITGYLRVKGGRHYPTDVISGALVGGLVGFMVPHWHRSKKNQFTQLHFSPNNLSLSILF